MRIDAIFTDLDAHTFDPERPRASRIGVFNGRIIGFDEDLDGISADRVESLGGATVLPGFTDAHCHTAWFGLTLASVDVTALPGGLPDVYAALEEAAAATPAGEWINATGYAHRDYDGQYPDLTRLDEITGARPLLMRQTSAPAALANTARGRPPPLRRPVPRPNPPRRDRRGPSAVHAPDLRSRRDRQHRGDAPGRHPRTRLHRAGRRQGRHRPGRPSHRAARGDRAVPRPGPHPALFARHPRRGDRPRHRPLCEGGHHLLRRMRHRLRLDRPLPHRDQRLSARSGGGQAAGPGPADAAGRWTAHDRGELGRRVRHRTGRGTAHRP